jgi:hypothetical protein
MQRCYVLQVSIVVQLTDFLCYIVYQVFRRTKIKFDKLKKEKKIFSTSKKDLQFYFIHCHGQFRTWRYAFLIKGRTNVWVWIRLTNTFISLLIQPSLMCLSGWEERDIKKAQKSTASRVSSENIRISLRPFSLVFLACGSGDLCVHRCLDSHPNMHYNFTWGLNYKKPWS